MKQFAPVQCWCRRPMAADAKDQGVGVMALVEGPPAGQLVVRMVVTVDLFLGSFWLQRQFVHHRRR